MKKIDILNYITDFRKNPNDIKTHTQVVQHLGTDNETKITEMVSELAQTRVIRITELKGEKAYQVISR